MSEVISQKDKQKNLIIHKNLWSVMLKLSWPAVIAMVLFGLNTVIDAMFVGRFVSETALAGVSMVYPLTSMSLGVGSLVGVGAGSLLSIALGSKNKRQQLRLMGNVNSLTLVSTVIYMLVGLLFSEPLIRMMGGQGAVLDLGNTYFRMTVYGAFFWIYGLAANMIVRAEGKMKSAAVMMAMGLVVNIIANYILIVVLDFGVIGAAWGTNIGMFVYTLVGWIYFSKGSASFKTKVFALYMDKDMLKSIVGLGIPSLIMNIMSLIQGIVVFNALSKFGTVLDIAFYGIVYRIFTFMLTPIFGLMRALQPVVGINYGAEKWERVIKSFKIFAVTATLLILPFWLVAMLSPTSILGLMLPERNFLALELMHFRIYMAILPLLSVIFMAMTFFPAVEKGKPAALIGIIRQLVFYVPVMLIVPRFLGVTGIYMGSLVIDTIIVLWTVLLIRKEFARLRKGISNATDGQTVTQV